MMPMRRLFGGPDLRPFVCGTTRDFLSYFDALLVCHIGEAAVVFALIFRTIAIAAAARVDQISARDRSTTKPDHRHP